MRQFPSPFDAPLGVLEPTPSDYVATFGDAFTLATPEPLSDPRAAALMTRRPSRVDALRRDAEKIDPARFLDEVRRGGVGVVGMGLMGVSIAATALNAEFDVLAYDSSTDALNSAPERIVSELLKLRSNMGIALPDPNAEKLFIAETLMSRFHTTRALEDVARRPVTIESTPEKPRLKQALYRKLEEVVPNEASPTLLTNTSSLTLATLSEKLSPDVARPISGARFAGFHFFHPAVRRTPVEIAVGPSTSAETLAHTVALARAFRKQPVVVADAPGFLVNRLLQAYLNEALAALDEGCDAEAIERAALRFGMEGAPLRVVDEIGADVALHSGWSFFKAFPQHTHSSRILPEMVRTGRLGRKSQHGFYQYASRSSWRDDATFDASRAELERLAPGYASTTVPARFHTEEALALRYMTSILFEAARLVEEGVVGSLREADAALVLALGFPEEKGGVCRWSFAYGLDNILAAAREFEPLGARFNAPNLLLNLQRELQ